MNDAAGSLSSLSVVIPAFNAAGCVAQTLAEVRAWLDRHVATNEIIVVDDGSRDDTAARVEAFGQGVRLLRNETNRGKGFSVRRGMLETRHAWALFMDVDHSTRISELERIASQLKEADVWIASRRVPGARIVRRQHRIRQALGRSFPYLVRALVLPDLHDTQCGFKLFSRRATEAIFPRQTIERFAFDVELLVLAREAGLTIREFPVDWNNPTASTLKIHADTIQMFADVLRLAWRHR